MIKCEWDHDDCFASERKQRYGQSQLTCSILTDCDFPKRKDCPFYKKQEQPTKLEDVVIPFEWKGDFDDGE